MINRRTLTEDIIRDDIETMRGICDSLEDLLESSMPFYKFIKENGYSEMKFRELLSDVQSIKRIDGMREEKELAIDYSLDHILSPSEKAYKNIFNLSDEELYNTILPDDFEETLDAVMHAVLPDRSRKIFERICSGETYEEASKSFDITRERVRQIWIKSLRTLRSPSCMAVLEKGLKGYKNYKAEKEKVKEEAEREALKEYGKECFDEKYDSLFETDDGLGALNLSVRSYNCLHLAGAKTVDDVGKFIEENSLRNLKGLGVKSYMEIVEKYNMYQKQKKLGEELEEVV